MEHGDTLIFHRLPMTNFDSVMEKLVGWDNCMVHSAYVLLWPSKDKIGRPLCWLICCLDSLQSKDLSIAQLEVAFSLPESVFSGHMKCEMSPLFINIIQMLL